MHIKIEFYLWFVRTTQYRHIHTYLLTHRSMIVVNPPLLKTMSMKCDRAIIYVLMTAFTTFISNLRPAHSTQNSATFLQGKKNTVLVTLISHLHAYAHAHADTPTIRYIIIIFNWPNWIDSSCVHFIQHLSPSNNHSFKML